MLRQAKYAANAIITNRDNLRCFASGIGVSLPSSMSLSRLTLTSKAEEQAGGTRWQATPPFSSWDMLQTADFNNADDNSSAGEPVATACWSAAISAALPHSRSRL